jgi:hypothetical protein
MKKIFISYSHKDENWKERLVTQLKVLALEGFCDVWDDRRIATGDDWKPEIEKALNEADIAILMVSADFLVSNFIRTEEVPRILERRKTEGLWVIPLFVKPCPWKKVKWLAKIQGEPRDGKSLEERDHKWEADKIMSDLAVKIAERIEVDEKIIHPVQPPPKPQSPSAPVENPFNETRAIQDPERFIGREADTRRLSQMLSGGSVVLTGEPKIGKSSLMLHVARNRDGGEEIIGPLDCMALDNREDFFGQIAGALKLGSSDWRGIRDTLKNGRRLLLVDEFDLAPRKGLTYDDLLGFRAICQANRDFKMLVISLTSIKEIFPYPGTGSYAYDFGSFSL